MWQSLIVVAVIAALVILGRLMERRQRPHRKAKDPLDQVLLWWSRNDPLTVRDLLNGGIAIFGRTGSGKTSSSGKQLALAILRAKSGGLILCAKPEDREMWEAWFQAAGRASDLIVFEPSGPHRFAVLDYMRKAGGDTRDLAKAIATIAEGLRGSDTDSMEDGKFWEQSAFRVFFCAIEIVKHATGQVRPWDLQQFINGAALGPDAFKNEVWLAGFHNQCLKAALSKEKTAQAAHDCKLAADMWIKEWPAMADKTRSSILAHVMGTLHVFNTGVVHDLVATETTVSPDDMLKGKWILVNMPLPEYGDSGAFVYGCWKYACQRAILRRKAKPEDGFACIWADEAQTVVTTYDPHFLAQCRSHMGCMVYLSQSLSIYYSSMGGKNPEHKAYALMGNFAGAKVFHALGDQQTAEWAAGLLGKQREVFVGSSMQPVENMFDEVMGRGKITTSTSEHYEHVLQPRVFQNGLRTGGIENGLICDGIVIRSGKPFANGESWLWCAFPQQ